MLSLRGTEHPVEWKSFSLTLMPLNYLLHSCLIMPESPFYPDPDAPELPPPFVPDYESTFYPDPDAPELPPSFMPDNDLEQLHEF